MDFIAAHIHPQPVKLSDNCKDFINQLLNKDQSKRLGTAGGWKEVVSHPWLKDINIQDLLDKKIQPMFKPTPSKDLTANFDTDFTKQELEFSIVPMENERLIQYRKNLFNDFEK